MEDTTYIQTQYISHDRLAPALSLCNVTPDVPRSLSLVDNGTDHPETTDTSLDLARGPHPPIRPVLRDSRMVVEPFMSSMMDPRCSLEAVWTLTKRSNNIMEG